MGEIAFSKDSHNLKALTFIGNAKLKILDRSSFNLSSCDERLSVCVPRFVLLYNTLCKHSFFCVLQLNWTILRNVSAMSTTMSETWKAQRSSLKISLTTDDGDEVSTEGEAKGRFVS